MTFLAIIPARGGSKRLPRKNFLRLNGKSLLQMAIDCAKEAGIFDDIVVSTDDEEGLIAASEAGVQTIDRHRALCDDKVQTASVVFDALGRYSYRHDAFCVLNPTSPLRKVDTVRHLCRMLLKEDMDCIMTHAGALGEKHDGVVLACKTQPFLQTLDFYKLDIYWYSLAYPTESLDINTAEDFEKAEWLVKEGVLNGRRLATLGQE